MFRLHENGCWRDCRNKSAGVGELKFWEFRVLRMKGRSLLIHLVSRLAHRAFFLDDEEKDRAVALMRRVEAGVQASMSYCINKLTLLPHFGKMNGYEIFDSLSLLQSGAV